MPVQTWLDLMLLVLVVSAAITDLAFRKIPNLLLLAAWCGVFGLHLAGATPPARPPPRSAAPPPASPCSSPCMRCAAWPPATSS